MTKLNLPNNPVVDINKLVNIPISKSVPSRVSITMPKVLSIYLGVQ